MATLTVKRGGKEEEWVYSYEAMARRQFKIFNDSAEFRAVASVTMQTHKQMQTLVSVKAFLADGGTEEVKHPEGPPPGKKVRVVTTNHRPGCIRHTFHALWLTSYPLDKPAIEEWFECARQRAELNIPTVQYSHGDSSTAGAFPIIITSNVKLSPEDYVYLTGIQIGLRRLKPSVVTHWHGSEVDPRAGRFVYLEKDKDAVWKDILASRSADSERVAVSILKLKRG